MVQDSSLITGELFEVPSSISLPPGEQNPDPGVITTIRSLLARARRFCRAGYHKETIDLMKRATALLPQSSQLWICYAQALAHMGYEEQAANVLLEADKANPYPRYALDIAMSSQLVRPLITRARGTPRPNTTRTPRVSTITTPNYGAGCVRRPKTSCHVHFISPGPAPIQRDPRTPVSTITLGKVLAVQQQSTPQLIPRTPIPDRPTRDSLLDSVICSPAPQPSFVNSQIQVIQTPSVHFPPLTPEVKQGGPPGKRFSDA